ncbi:MAG: ATP-binding protein, partial [Poseidonibacter sp.]
MYIGSTSLRGLHHLVWEIVDNSIDEALAGHCDEISVTISKENTIIVKDNGRGMPIDEHPTMKKPAVEVIHTVLHAGGKFGGGGYKVSGGLHGVGASVVNALSEWMTIQVFRNKQIYQITFEKGHTTVPLKILGPTEFNGTRTEFKPDSEIFDELIFDYQTLKVRLKELGYLNKGIKIIFKDEREEKPVEETYHYEGGISEFTSYLNRNRKGIHEKIIYGEAHKDSASVEVALQYTDGYTENVFTFANNINTHEGGTHLSGFRASLTRVINDYARNKGFIKEKDSNFTGEDVREGLTASISVKLEEPQFEGQTK